jgi:hypothetical protein
MGIQKRVEDPVENLRRLKALEAKVYGPEVIKKVDSDAGVATPAYSTAPDWWQPVFGRRMWSFLNYDKTAFAITPKEVWLQSGWRMVTAAAQSFAHSGAELAGGLARGGALPDTISITPVVQSVQPKEIMHTWGVSELNAFLSSVDDAVEIIPEMRREIGLEHASIINRMMIQSVEYLAGNASANWTGTNNIESFDRLLSSDAEEDAIGGTHDAYYDPWTAYATTEVDRDSGTTYDAIVEAPGGTLGTDGDLTVSVIDSVWRQIREAGGEPDVILTGADFVIALSEILEPERRFIGEASIRPSYGGVSGIGPGVEGSFTVSTFRGLPIIDSPYVRCTDATYGDTISKAYMLSTPYLRYRTAVPTKYMETPSEYITYLANDALRIEGGYLTVGELVCYRFNVQGKIRDIQ